MTSDPQTKTDHDTGFPLDFFPVLFAVPRVVGWLAHWRQVRAVPGHSDLARTTHPVPPKIDDASGRWCQDLATTAGTRIAMAFH
jgi:hypothetical protein